MTVQKTDLPNFVLLAELPNQEFKACWDELVGIDEIKEQVLSHISFCLNDSQNKWQRKFYRNKSPICVRPKGRILLIGASGTGKTTLAKGAADAYARRCGKEGYFVELGAVRSKFLGKSAQNMRNFFETVRALAEERMVIVLLDEYDTIAPTRGFEQMNDDVREMVNTLMKEMDKTSKNVFIIAASNLEENVDFAAERRFDWVIEFKRPTFDDRIRLIETFIGCFDIDNETTLSVAERTENYTQYDLYKIATWAIERAVYEDQPLDASHLFGALQYVKPTLEYRSSGIQRTDRNWKLSDLASFRGKAVRR